MYFTKFFFFFVFFFLVRRAKSGSPERMEMGELQRNAVSEVNVSSWPPKSMTSGSLTSSGSRGMLRRMAHVTSDDQMSSGELVTQPLLQKADTVS